jgi:TetR/AcrR family transcriptional regulator
MAEPTDSRAAILDAAERCFADQGFPATTIKRIAGAAGVNTALLYYYFSDKQGLYHAVLERALGGLAAEGLRGLEGGLDTREAVRRFVRAQASYMRAHPALPHLLVRELVDHRAAHATAGISHVAATLFARLCEVIRVGQADGTFRRDLDPRLAAISIVSQVAYWHIARPAVGILLGFDAAGPAPEVSDQFAQHAAAFALAALSSDRRSSDRPPLRSEVAR